MNAITERFVNTYKSMGLTGYRMGKTSSVITKQKISHIEKGLYEVSIEMISDFCQTYQVNANYILTGKGNMFLNSESPELLSKEEVEGMPSPESAEYWERMYKSAVTTYEAMLQNLEERFNALDKPLKDMRELLVERKKIV